MSNKIYPIGIQNFEKIRSEAYNHMIELAEQQFNIPIRKKSGTKQ